MTVLQIFQYVALFLNGFSLGMAIYSLWLSLGTNRRLIKKNQELLEVCHSQVLEIVRLRMLLCPNHEDLTSEEN